VTNTDDADAVADLGAKPFQLWQLIPPALHGVLLNIQWDRDALFRLRLPVEELPVSELRWQLDLPWWRDKDRYFAATPNEVRADRARYHVHWQRTLDADLHCPIHLLATTPVLRMLDGVHRLLKADELGCDRILACRVDRDQLKKIVIPR
jgi:hypothetical protein